MHGGKRFQRADLLEMNYGDGNDRTIPTRVGKTATMPAGNYQMTGFQVGGVSRGKFPAASGLTVNSSASSCRSQPAIRRKTAVKSSRA